MATIMEGWRSVMEENGAQFVMTILTPMISL